MYRSGAGCICPDRHPWRFVFASAVFDDRDDRFLELDLALDFLGVDFFAEAVCLAAELFRDVPLRAGAFFLADDFRAAPKAGNKRQKTTIHAAKIRKALLQPEYATTRRWCKKKARQPPQGQRASVTDTNAG